MNHRLVYCAASVYSLLTVACVTAPSPRGRTLPESVGNVTALSQSAAAGAHPEEVRAILKEWDDWITREFEARLERGEFEAAIGLIEAERRARFGDRIGGPPGSPLMAAPEEGPERESYDLRQQLCRRAWRAQQVRLSVSHPRADPFWIAARAERAYKCLLTGLPGGVSSGDLAFLSTQYAQGMMAARQRGHVATAALLSALDSTLPNNRFKSLALPGASLDDQLSFEGVPCKVPHGGTANPKAALRVVLTKCEGNAGPLTSQTVQRKVVDTVPVYETGRSSQDCTTTPAITEQVCLAYSKNGSCINSTTVTRVPSQTNCRGGESVRKQVGSQQVERVVEETKQSRLSFFVIEGRAVYDSPTGPVEMPLRAAAHYASTYPSGAVVPTADTEIDQRKREAVTELYKPLFPQLRELRRNALEPALASTDPFTREDALIREAIEKNELLPETIQHFERTWGLSAQTLRAVIFGGTVEPKLSDEELARYKVEIPSLAPAEEYQRQLPKRRPEYVDEDE